MFHFLVSQCCSITIHQGGFFNSDSIDTVCSDISEDIAAIGTIYQ